MQFIIHTLIKQALKITLPGIVYLCFMFASPLLAQVNSNIDHITFEQTILQAEESFKAKDYPTAKRLFEKALDLDPSAKYPKDRLAAIRAVYTDPSDVSRFNEAMQKGQVELDRSNFDKARNWFEIALAAQPDSRSARDKIAETECKKADSLSRKEKYDKLMAEAEKLLTLEKRGEARVAYQSASELLPAESLPKLRIIEIDRWLQEKKSVQDSFEKAIEAGDQFYMNRDFGNARIKYQEALKIKPDARYPKDMIMKAEQGEAQTRSETERYDATVASADVFYKSGDLEAALTGYRTALELKPGADYPSKKITEIEKSIFEKNSRQEAFQLAIRNGDQAFSENNWEVALKHYKDALTLKPDEQYPKDRIKAIETILADNKARDEAYSSAIEDGDAMFEQKLYDKAIESYEGALSVKPGEKYPTEQITEARRKISERETNQKNYDNSIASGEQQFQSGKFEEALLSFKAASLLKPGDPYPASRISEIQKKLAEIKVRDDSYSRAIADGDLFFNQKKYREALEPYERASTIKPEESYPKAQKEQIFKLLDDQKKLDDEFNQLIANGEKLFNDKQFLPSLDIFKQAQKLKPLEQIPQEKIVAIQSILEEIRVREEAASQALALEKEKQDRLYTDAITEGDQLLASQNFIDAKRAYIRASELKPTENYPKDKLKEINLVLESQAKAVKEEYDKAITDADKLYLQKILDQAVEAYESAASIKPDENYPFEMIRKIKQYIADHSILEVNTVTVIIPSGDEKKFNFRGIEPRLRNNNYVMIRARALGTTVPKVYFNYGRDNAKNGGIVLRTISTREGVDYLIRLAGQDKWYREDNNWLSLYTEGCDLEVSRIEISQGD